ncbi:hypothetical protein ACFL3M_03385 [Patescibacteria group bacterium]
MKNIEVDYSFLTEKNFKINEDCIVYGLESSDLWDIVRLTMKFGNMSANSRTGEFTAELPTRSAFLVIEGSFSEEKKFVLNVHVAPPELAFRKEGISCQVTIMRFEFGDSVFWAKDIGAWEVREDLKEIETRIMHKNIN